MDCGDPERRDNPLCRIPAPAMSPAGALVSSALMLGFGVALLWMRRRARA
jgi:hypothetical protein